MRVPLVVHMNVYGYETTSKWQAVWSDLCRMAYETHFCETLMTYPDSVEFEDVVHDTLPESAHSRFYAKQSPDNSEVLTLDYTWKRYSRTYADKMPRVVPTFKHLRVPKALFESLGVAAWFKHSFPNCKVTYWDE